MLLILWAERLETGSFFASLKRGEVKGQWAPLHTDSRIRFEGDRDNQREVRNTTFTLNHNSFHRFPDARSPRGSSSPTAPEHRLVDEQVKA